MLQVVFSALLTCAFGVQLEVDKSCIQKKVVVSGIVYNQREVIANGVAKMTEIGEVFCDYHLVLYENDSPDDTAGAIKAAFASIGDRATLVSERNVVFPWPGRTGRIAGARQKLLEHIKSEHGTADFVIFTDLDFGAGTAGWAGMAFGQPVQQCIPDVSSIQKAVALDSQWDVLSFKVSPYWDIWALRGQKVAPQNCWRDGVGGPKGWPLVKGYSKAVSDALQGLQPNEFLPVESAFMLLEIIKMPMLNGVSYVDPKGDCEHVPFHQAMTAQNGARVRISPMNLCKTSAFPSFNSVPGFGNFTLASEQSVEKCMREGGTPDTCFLARK